MGAGVCHGKHSRRVMAQGRMKLVLKRVARAVCAIAIRRTALNHKATHHSMKGQAVVERAAFSVTGGKVEPAPMASGKGDEVRHRPRRPVVMELAGKGPRRGLKIGVNAILRT